MLVQEPVQAAIWHCLNHYAYNDAIFLAERLKAEVESEETIWLLATCYYRSGKPHQAYSLLKNSSSPQCKFLLAKCCLDLQKTAEAENVLIGEESGRSKSFEDVVKEFGDVAGFALMLLASVCFSTERHQKGVDASRKALKLNPFLWSVFEQLCRRGDRPDPAKVFNLNGAVDVMTNVTGSNPVIAFVNSQSNLSCDTAPTNNTLDSNKSCHLGTPVTVVNMGNMVMTGVRALTPDMPTIMPNVARPKRAIRYKNIFPGAVSPLTPSFGVVPLDLSLDIDGCPSPLTTLSEVNDQKSNLKRQLLRKDTPLQTAKTIFNQSSNTNNMSSTPQPQSVRRSSRLFTNSCAVKENTKSPNRSKFASPKSPSKKTKCRLAKQALARSVDLNEKNSASSGVRGTGSGGPVIIGGLETPVGGMSSVNLSSVNLSNDSTAPSGGGTPCSAKSTSEQVLALQKTAVEGLLTLMRELGQAYLSLSQFECNRAIEVLQSLPPHHKNTGWVLNLVGKAYFELADYKQACKAFAEVRKIDSERCHMMEIYSTALWHLQKEAALSALAQDLVALDKNSPEAWCAAGNCYSLQKEHDVAIKFFQRAVQVDPNFAYAYTLLGHEYVATEELEKGMSCFRNAARLDSRHYNAWYGIGTIYSKQEKFQLAELHFKRALSIHPNSCVLMCHIGVVQLALQRKEQALETLNKAVSLDPKNPLCKFHRASILTSLNRHHEALVELDQLKEIVPKESLVYYLTGKVHKKLGNTHLALMHFSWATDLDPKGATTQIKEAIDPGISSHSQDPGEEDSAAEETASEMPNNLGGESTPVGGSVDSGGSSSGGGSAVEHNESDDAFL